MRKIKLLVMDVDGTLTDGRIYMGQEGESLKAFDIKDGAGIMLLLPQLGIVPVIITARKSHILENRCKELRIEELHQDCLNKLEKLDEIVCRYNVGFESVAYVGDDLPDMPCMKKIKESGGLILCPADAILEIKRLSDFVSRKKAGRGAIRDCINYLNKDVQDNYIETRVKKSIDLILNRQFEDKPEGILPDGNTYIIQEYMTKKESDCVIETHLNHIDIQYIIEGSERFNCYSTKWLASSEEYNKEIDVEYWKDGVISSQNILVPGSIIVIYPNQPHKGAIVNSKTEKVKKLICKIAV